MRGARVCIYGGTDLTDVHRKFISAVACRILSEMPGSMIVTGGFKFRGEKPGAVSTDVAALEGARRYVKERGGDLRNCYQAWIPEPRLDSRLHDEGVMRMGEEDGVAVQVVHRTALGRRLAMVSHVDLVVTIAGQDHTQVVIEQALELGVPVLPIPIAGGDSERLLGKYEPWVAAGFEPGALQACVAKVRTAIGEDPETAARAVVELIGAARFGKCLVLLPYRPRHKVLYDSVIRPAVAKHMVPVRLDLLPRSDAIYSSFAEEMRTATAVVVDVTDVNENVMYEIGYAHGRGIAPLIFTQDQARLRNLPVYLSAVNVRWTRTDDELGNVIAEYLQSFRAKRNPAGMPTDGNQSR